MEMNDIWKVPDVNTVEIQRNPSSLRGIIFLRQWR